MSDFNNETINQKSLDPYKRIKYSMGLVLGVDEFEQEQLYFLEKNRLHNRALHGYGTVCGLNVSVRDREGKTEVVVAPGIAVAPAGQEIRVPTTQCGDIDLWLGRNQDEIRKSISEDGTIRVYVVLCYRECERDKVPVPGVPCRSQEESMANSRIEDFFELKLSLKPPPMIEEEIVRRFGDLITNIEITPDAAEYTDSFKLEEIVRNLKNFIPDKKIFLSPGDADSILRNAFRVFVTEVKPKIRGKDDGCFTSDGDCVCLARLDVPVIQSENKVSLNGEAKDIAVALDDRPFLLHTRLLQEWLLCGKPGMSKASSRNFATLFTLEPGKIRVWVHHNATLEDISVTALDIELNGESCCIYKVERISINVNVFDISFSKKDEEGPYVFNWDEVEDTEKNPGNEKYKLINYLNQKFGLEWLDPVQGIIRKIDDGNKIKVKGFFEWPPSEQNYFLIKLNDSKTSASLTISTDKRTDKYIAKLENKNLNIYEYSTVEKKGDTIALRFYCDNIYEVSQVLPRPNLKDVLAGMPNPYLEWNGKDIIAYLIVDLPSLSDLTDVSMPDTVNDGDVLVNRHGKWTSGKLKHHDLDELGGDDHPQYLKIGSDAGGDLSGTYPDPSVVKLQGKDISDIPPDLTGQLLTWNDENKVWYPDLQNLSGHSDVKAENPTKGDVLTWDGSDWVPRRQEVQAQVLHYLPFVTINRSMYLFNWEKIPGDDEEKLRKFFQRKYGLEWVYKGTFKRDDNTIVLSYEENEIILVLDTNEARVDFRIDSIETVEYLIARKENEVWNIYAFDITEGAFEVWFDVDAPRNEAEIRLDREYLSVFQEEEIPDYLADIKITDIVKIRRNVFIVILETEAEYMRFVFNTKLSLKIKSNTKSVLDYAREHGIAFMGFDGDGKDTITAFVKGRPTKW